MSFTPPASLDLNAGDTARAQLARVGVIDIGSNSVRMVVFDGMARTPAYFFNEKALCGLGRDLPQTGRLHEEGRESALRVLRRFAALARSMDLTALSAVATAAVREAEDGPDFVAQVRRETGMVIHVATGAEEATLSAQGVLLGWPEAEGLVCDIGGSSMELAHLAEGRIGNVATSALGPLALRVHQGKARAAHITHEIAALRRAVPAAPTRLFLVGGSWRALAQVDMARRAYPLGVLHEYTQLASDLGETLDWVRQVDTEKLREIAPGVSSARIALMPEAVEVLQALLAAYGPKEVVISSYGLREGLLFAHMPPELSVLDPLLESARHMEQARARVPGFGDLLYNWMAPVFDGANSAQARLIRAACLLHDVNWRTHPDFRAETCFESVTRDGLGRINHAGRVFLGLALMKRYKQGDAPARLAALTALLSDAERAMAQAVGRAMRLGAIVSGGSASLLSATRLERDAGVLWLHIGADAHLAEGDTVEKRLASLANGLGLEARISNAR